jgi:hypothetical protein
MSIPVDDPFGVRDDPAMPTLAPALDPGEAQQQFGHGLPRLSGENGVVNLRAIRVTRYKPLRRCIIEYDVATERPDAPSETATLIGKVRVKRSGKSGLELMEKAWNAGFSADSRDGISVPEPIGLIESFHMWLQRKVSGRTATELLAEPNGKMLAQKIAEAAHKLHLSGIPPKRSHSLADELRILHERLPAVAQENPRWERRITRLLEACERLAVTLPEPIPQGIHRDFYADQVIVDGPRLYLIDFDLYCSGDPALDIGNFMAHITEQSLRCYGDPSVLQDSERALEERFLELAGQSMRLAVRTYATLTLVRHIHLSTLFPERRHLTGQILELCEERLCHNHS